MAAKFNLAALMGEDVSKLDTSQIEYIPIDRIDDNEGNFYTVGNVDELAESIELIGLQEPLLLLQTGARYRIIAGHRRRKAAEQAGLKTVPCIVHRQLTEAQEGLMLILTNSTARELTHWEKIQQAKKLKALFVQRKEEGAALPGRVRDMVAEAMQESASQVARMEVIDKHLIPAWKKRLEQDLVSPSIAYELARIPREAQNTLMEQRYRRVMSSARIKAAGEIVGHYDFAPLICPMDFGDRPCTRYKERAPMVADGKCPGCCHECEQADTCPLVCGHRKKQLADQQRAADMRQEQDALDAAYMASDYRRAQIALKRVLKRYKSEMQDMPHGIRSFAKPGEVSRTMCMPTLSDLFAFSERTGVSVAEMLGLDDA